MRKSLLLVNNIAQIYTHVVNSCTFTVQRTCRLSLACQHYIPFFNSYKVQGYSKQSTLLMVTNAGTLDNI